MQFLKDFLRNPAILIVIGLVVYFMHPDMMKQVYEADSLIFGPLAIPIVIVCAFPRKRKSWIKFNYNQICHYPYISIKDAGSTLVPQYRVPVWAEGWFANLFPDAPYFLQ